MYEADACKIQASAFFRCRKITDANVLNGFFKRLGTILKMKTERFTAVKRSVFVCVLSDLRAPEPHAAIARKSG